MNENNEMIETREIEIKNIEKASFIQIKRILSFYNHDSQKADYTIVKNKLDSMSKPLIDKAHYGERIWSYFYQKYLIRVVLILILFMGIGASKANPAVVQASRRMFSSSWAFTFFIAVIAVVIWKLSLSFLTSKYSTKKTWIKNRLGIITVNKDGKEIGFLRSLFIQILKSYSAPLWLIALAWISENMLSTSSFKFVEIFTGSIYQGGIGVFTIVAFALFFFWIADMIILELKGRSLHDRISKTYTITCMNETSEEDRKNFIAENY